MELDFWILDGRVPKLTHSTDEYMAWARSGDDLRRVALSHVGNVQISTVYLAGTISHEAGEHFETMVRGDCSLDEYAWHYGTWEEAEEGHQKVVEQVRADLLLQDAIK